MTVRASGSGRGGGGEVLWCRFPHSKTIYPTVSKKKRMGDTVYN